MSEKEPIPLLQSDNNGGNSGFQENIGAVILKYVRYWPWFVVCIVMALVTAYMINRYSVKNYIATSSVKVIEKSGELGLIADLGEGVSFGGKGVNLANEAPVFKSRKLIDSVVTSLELQNTYYKKGRFIDIEIWGNELPFKVIWQGDSLPAKASPLFNVEFNPSPKYSISLEDGSEPVQAQIGDTISYKGFKFSLVLNKDYYGTVSNFKKGQFQFKYSTGTQMINTLLSNLKINQLIEKSDILTVSYQGPNKAKNEAIVDSVISKYNMDDIRDKRRVSLQAERFLAKRLNILYQELDSVERGLVNYMRSSGMVTVESTASKLFAKETEAEKRAFNYTVQKQMTENFKEQLLMGGDYRLLPVNMGIESGTINSLTSEYNLSVMERNDRLVSSTLENPQVKKLTAKLDNLKENILKSINGYLRDIESSMASLEEREKGSTSRLSEIPAQSKMVKGIERQQHIKEQLYLYLLQQHEQAALTYATIDSSIKVIDYAYTSGGALGPNEELTYVIAFLLGLVLPFGFFYFKFLFYSRIDTKEDLQRLLPNVTVLAEIPQIYGDKDSRLITTNDRSNLAEAFRILRSNLGFYKTYKEEGRGQVLFVTSTIKGEGKTFVALNTAHAMAAAGNKTLIIGTDLRNPQTHKYYKRDKNDMGVTNYLTDRNVGFDELVINNDHYFENLDLIIAGQIPPNPAELLMNGRFEELLQEAKKRYDYIIVDTAPTILVADTLLISELADITLYIVKSGYTDNKLTGHIRELIERKKVGTMGIVLNGLGPRGAYGYSYSYNYGYGYGYGADIKKPWWKFWGN